MQLKWPMIPVFKIFFIFFIDVFLFLEYGLAASIWTRDLKNALVATKQLKAGVVQVNQNFVLNPNFPVGGWKSSGLGREASLEAMIETFTKPKLVSMNLA
jgi:aldehyde dehydrogenase (NAD+)